MRLIPLINLKLEPRASSRPHRVQHRRRVRTEERQDAAWCTQGCILGYTTRVVYTRLYYPGGIYRAIPQGVHGPLIPQGVHGPLIPQGVYRLGIPRVCTGLGIPRDV